MGKNLGWHKSRLTLPRKPQYVLEKLSTIMQILMEQISTPGARKRMLMQQTRVVLLTQTTHPKVPGLHARRDVENAACKSWTLVYNKGSQPYNCYLKTEVPPPTQWEHNDGIISGLKEKICVDYPSLKSYVLDNCDTEGDSRTLGGNSYENCAYACRDTTPDVTGDGWGCESWTYYNNFCYGKQQTLGGEGFDYCVWKAGAYSGPKAEP